MVHCKTLLPHVGTNAWRLEPWTDSTDLLTNLKSSPGVQGKKRNLKNNLLAVNPPEPIKCAQQNRCRCRIWKKWVSWFLGNWSKHKEQLEENYSVLGEYRYLWIVENVGAWQRLQAKVYQDIRLKGWQGHRGIQRQEEVICVAVGTERYLRRKSSTSPSCFRTLWMCPACYAETKGTTTSCLGKSAWSKNCSGFLHTTA